MSKVRSASRWTRGWNGGDGEVAPVVADVTRVKRIIVTCKVRDGKRFIVRLIFQIPAKYDNVQRSEICQQPFKLYG